MTDRPRRATASTRVGAVARRGRAWSAVGAVALAAGAVLVATLLASGIGAVSSVVVAVIAVLLVITGSSSPGLALAAGALAIACGAAATPTLGSDVGRGLMIAGPPLAVAAAASATDTTPRSRAARALVWVGGALAGPVTALLEDPFLDATCAGCRHNAFAVLADRTAATAAVVVGVLLLAAGTGLSIRRSRRPVLTAATAAAALGLLPALALDPVLVATVAAGVAVLAVGASSVEVALTRRRLAQLEQDLRAGADPTALLRRETGDPTLRIEFPAARSGSVGIPVRAGDETIAMVHTSAQAEAWALLERPGPELIMTLVGARLDAELDARVLELRESRSRVVIRADEERRRLERDLHDGAQQHVLALGFDLRAALVREQDPARKAVLESCLDETMRALDDLRDIAHGVYPPLLAIAGLAPALRALGTRTPVAVVPGDLPGSLPQSVERVAYLLVSELAFGAAGPVEPSGEVDGDLLRFSVTCRGAEPGDLLRERIAALDGTITRTTSKEEDRWLLTVPCG